MGEDSSTQEVSVVVKPESVRMLVKDGEEFSCPYCGRRYDIEDDGYPGAIGLLDGEECSHIDFEIFPVNGGLWEVYFHRGW
jgi:hypothetical protein